MHKFYNLYAGTINSLRLVISIYDVVGLNFFMVFLDLLANMASLIEYTIIAPKKHRTQKIMGISPESGLWSRNGFPANGKNGCMS